MPPPTNKPTTIKFFQFDGSSKTSAPKVSPLGQMLSFPLGQFLEGKLDADPLILNRHSSPSH
jgi:hypothetical protein